MGLVLSFTNDAASTPTNAIGFEMRPKDTGPQASSYGRFPVLSLPGLISPFLLTMPILLFASSFRCFTYIPIPNQLLHISSPNGCLPTTAPFVPDTKAKDLLDAVEKLWLQENFIAFTPGQIQCFTLVLCFLLFSSFDALEFPVASATSFWSSILGTGTLHCHPESTLYLLSLTGSLAVISLLLSLPSLLGSISVWLCSQISCLLLYCFSKVSPRMHGSNLMIHCHWSCSNSPPAKWPDAPLFNRPGTNPLTMTLLTSKQSRKSWCLSSSPLVRLLLPISFCAYQYLPW